MSMRRVLNGRVATKVESEGDAVVFFVPDGRRRPYSFGRNLPILARITKTSEEEDFPPLGTVIEIVQAEIVDDENVLLGFVAGEDEGICALEDVEIIEESWNR